MNNLNTLLFCVLVTIAGNLPAQTNTNDPVEITRMTVDEIIDDMRSNEAVYTSDRVQLDAMVERRLLPRFNFNVMTQLAVGKYWAQASPEQKNKLTDEFRTLLVRTYTNMLFSNINMVYENRNGTVSTGKSSMTPNGDAIVEVVVTRQSGEPLSLSLRMRRDREDWKVIDISADGISLIVNYRASFTREASLSGIDGLIKSLVDKNLANSNE